ncbi:MAG: arabinogalactan endo-beta-1,4-galactanase [Candidatus Neomarinimicrobiota bacterium]
MYRIFSVIIIISVLAAGTSCDRKTTAGSNDSLIGGDVSFLAEIEHYGGQFYDGEEARDAISILKSHGFNAIRLKLWHTPAGDFNTLEKVAEMARRIKAQDMHFLLNFHYSDFWADPGKQYKPKVWEGLPFTVLKDSLYLYTKSVITTLRNQNTLPEMVQLGNEIRPGMLWPDGRVGGEYDTKEQWNQLAQLLKAARKGVLDCLREGEEIKIMIHIDNGGSNRICRWFFDNVREQGVEFDVIGLSFYPKWHGTFDSLKANLADLANRYARDIIIVETAYPWTLQWAERDGFDKGHNIFGTDADLHPGYPPTLDGQKAFFRELRAIVQGVPGNHGKGIYYWEPEWISVEGLGSHWENAALFDFDGKVLPSIDAFTGIE